MGTPFVLAVCRLYPRWARYFTFVGLVLSSLALIICSCCDNVAQLIAVQGFLFGAGGCISNGPCVLYINEWFVRRKGLAYGIVWSACGFGGVVLPLIIDALLSRCGFRTTMRIYAGIIFASSVPLAFWVKPRLRYSAHARVRLFNIRYLTFKLLVFHQLANAIQATGFFLPSIYLPTYARTIFHAPASLSSLTLILINISTMISSIVMGLLVDKLNVMTCIFISAWARPRPFCWFGASLKASPSYMCFVCCTGYSPGAGHRRGLALCKKSPRKAKTQGLAILIP